jgi:hypothetical protein
MAGHICHIGHLDGVPKRDSLNQPFGMTYGGPLWPVPSQALTYAWLASGALKKRGFGGTNLVITKNKLRPAAYKCLISMVAGPRIELGTRGFSVLP